jgi:hypothetical protein
LEKGQELTMTQITWLSDEVDAVSQVISVTIMQGIDDKSAEQMYGYGLDH